MAISKKYIKSRKLYKVSFDVAQEFIPTTEEVRLLGDFNSWNWDEAPEMKLSNETFSADLELPAGASLEFRYKSLNGAWYNDDKADDYVPSPVDHVHNCVVHLPFVEEEKPAPKKAAAPKKAPVAKKVPAAKKAVAAKKTTVAKPAKAAAKPAKKAAISAVKIDFTKIEGIGPKIAGLITAAGITTYEALADAKKKDLQTILSNAGSRYAMHDPTTWPKQSKLLAQGKLKELEKLKGELKGGKKK